jgi:hypothetical protein
LQCLSRGFELGQQDTDGEHGLATQQCLPTYGIGHGQPVYVRREQLGEHAQVGDLMLDEQAWSAHLVHLGIEFRPRVHGSYLRRGTTAERLPGEWFLARRPIADYPYSSRKHGEAQLLLPEPPLPVPMLHLHGLQPLRDDLRLNVANVRHATVATRATRWNGEITPRTALSTHNCLLAEGWESK